MSQEIDPNKVEGVLSPEAQEAAKKMEQMAQELAPKLHEQWQNDFKKKNPGETRRIKVRMVNGKWKNYPQDLVSMSEVEKAWVEQIIKDNPEYSATGVCEDLLNTPFENLSQDFAKENVDAATFVLGLISKEQAEKSRPLTIVPGTLEQFYAPKVHDAWSKRNPWNDLAEDEKQKDRVQVILAADKLGIKYDTMGMEGEVLQKEFDLLNMQMKAISNPRSADERYAVRDQLGLGHTPRDN